MVKYEDLCYTYVGTGRYTCHYVAYGRDGYVRVDLFPSWDDQRVTGESDKGRVTLCAIGRVRPRCVFA